MAAQQAAADSSLTLHVRRLHWHPMVGGDSVCMMEATQPTDCLAAQATVVLFTISFTFELGGLSSSILVLLCTDCTRGRRTALSWKYWVGTDVQSHACSVVSIFVAMTATQDTEQCRCSSCLDRPDKSNEQIEQGHTGRLLQISRQKVVGPIF